MNKALKWTLISIPVLAGGFLVYRVLTKKAREQRRILSQAEGVTPQVGGGGAISTSGGVSTPKPDFPMSLGSRGKKVQELQQAIVDDGQPTIVALLGNNPTDGKFGTGTEKAVSALIKKTSVDSQADIDTIKGLKAQRDAASSRQATLAAKKELASKLIALQKANLGKDFKAIRSTTGFGGQATADGRLVRTVDTKYQPGNFLLRIGSFRVNKNSKKFNAYVTASGDIVAQDENYWLLFNPNDTDVK